MLPSEWWVSVTSPANGVELPPTWIGLRSSFSVVLDDQLAFSTEVVLRTPGPSVGGRVPVVTKCW